MAAIDAYLQVLATDPVRAGILLVVAWVPAAVVAAGVLGAMAAIERRLAGTFRRRRAPRRPAGPVRPFMRQLLAAADPPARRPGAWRLAIAGAIAVALAVGTGYRALDLIPANGQWLPAPSAVTGR